MTISEADWRVFKEVRVVALNRLYHRILSECRTVCDDDGVTAHHRYLKLYALIHQRNEMRTSNGLSMISVERRRWPA